MHAKRWMCRFSLLAGVFLLYLLLLSLNAFAKEPSFKCYKAKTKVEKWICGDAVLSKLDRDMARIYGQLYGSLDESDQQTQLNEQRAWLNNRSDQCENAAIISTGRKCLEELYHQRINDLCERLRGKGIDSPCMADYAEHRKPFGLYVLTDRSFKFCNKLEENFNSFKYDPPMVCERRINPEFKDFQLPDWKPLSVKENMDLFKKIFKVMRANIARRWHRSVEDLWEEYQPTLNKKIKENEIQLWEARFDLDNDGSIEHVFKLMLEKCDPFNKRHFTWAPGPQLYVLDDINQSIDLAYEITGHASYDVLFYKERTFLAHWECSPDLKDIKIYVYKPSRPLPSGKIAAGIDYVCLYKYVRIEQGEGK